MRILPISLSNINKKHNVRKIDEPKDNITVLSDKTHYYPSFGYCDVHISTMKTLNESVKNSISKNFADYNKTLAELNDYKSKLAKIEQAGRKAAQLITQYSSYEYSIAEVIPSYALECSTELMAAIKQTGIFETPENILLTIANIPKLETTAGIDVHTKKPYTTEQTGKSRANSQLYATVIMLDLLDKKLSSSKFSDDEIQLITSMRNSVLDKISSIYGKDAYSRIQKLKMMGKDAAIEDKRASLRLLEEFDGKARDLDYDEAFYKNLDKLLKHSETLGTTIKDAFTEDTVAVPVIRLSYHTHPQELHDHEHIHEHTHDHIHEHGYSHEYMHQHGIEHMHKKELK